MWRTLLSIVSFLLKTLLFSDVTLVDIYYKSWEGSYIRLSFIWIELDENDIAWQADM